MKAERDVRAAHAKQLEINEASAETVKALLDKDLANAKVGTPRFIAASPPMSVF